MLVACGVRRCWSSYLDERGLAVFATGEPVTDFAVTLVTYTAGKEDSVFVRDYRAGVWWSSSPTPHTVVYGEPRVDPDCNACHAEHAATLGMFTAFAAREAIAQDRTAFLTCPGEPVTPCDVATYRDLRWR
jgi:hypothetical protein